MLAAFRTRFCAPENLVKMIARQAFSLAFLFDLLRSQFLNIYRPPVSRKRLRSPSSLAL
jgi:hypothetical protein